ncbi:MAG: protein kinase domain-containing protein [Gammaproteobacteria bacterium]
MSLSPKARLFSTSAFVSQDQTEIKHIERKHFEFKLPPQIRSRVTHNPNQKMMSDFAIGKIKIAVMKMVEEQQLIHKSQHPDATQADLDNLKFRRFRKEEIEAALGKIGMEEIKADLIDGKLPYGVYHAKISRDKTEKEIFAFINKGVKEFIEKAKKESRNRIEVEETQANILGIGGMGIVKVMQDMDDPSRCYALKIIRKAAASDDHNPSEEYKHAAQAGLALARFIRPSPAHGGRIQEEILMEYVPGINLETFFDPFRKIGSKEPAGSRLRPLDLLILLQKMAICVQESVNQFGSIHRDLTLRNFMYDPDTGSVKLVDYGLAVTPSAESKGIYYDPSDYGTAGYLAVEVAFGGPFFSKIGCFCIRYGNGISFRYD